MKKINKCQLLVPVIVIAQLFIINVRVFGQEYDNNQTNDSQIKFSIRSQKAIAGYCPQLNVTFSSIIDDKQSATVTITLPNRKQLTAKINYRQKTYSIRFTLLNSDHLVKTEDDDMKLLNSLAQTLPIHISSVFASKQAGDALLSVLSIVYGYPSNNFLDVYSEPRSEALSQSLCNQIGNTISGTYSLQDNMPIVAYHAVGPCDSGDCFGRCGSNCDSPPSSLIQRFTQNCFNHDLCAGATGQWFGPCKDEWISAIDDFLFAANCNEIKGDWTVTLSGTSCYQGNCANISFSTIYHFTSSGSKFTGKSDPNSIDGRVSTFKGVISNGNNINGNWNIPTYMGPECGSVPLGYANGTFTGKNNCGDLTMSLIGSWNWYQIDTCTLAESGSFVGNVTASTNTWNSVENTQVKKTNNLDTNVAPSLP